MASPENGTRTLWLLFAIGFAISLLGAAILFNPTLEFAAVDLLEKTKLPIGLIGNIALYAEAALCTISVFGLIVMALRPLLRNRRQH